MQNYGKNHIVVPLHEKTSSYLAKNEQETAFLFLHRNIY